MKPLFLIFAITAFLRVHSQPKDLDYYLKAAQRNSPLLSEINNQAKIVQLDQLLFRAANKPQVSVEFAGQYAPVFNGFGYDEIVTNKQTVSGKVGVSQKLLGAAAKNSQYEAFRILADALALNRKIALNDLSNSVIAQYISASATAEQLEHNARLTDLLNGEQAILKKLAQHSVYKQTDYLLFTATLQQQQLVLLQSRQQFKNDIALLNYLTGETDTAFVALAKPELQLTKGQSGTPYFTRQFEIDSLKYENKKRALNAQYKPQVSATADAGYLSSLTYEPARNFGVSVGVAVLLPIYDGRQKTLKQQQNDADYETLSAKQIFALKQNRQRQLMLEQKLQQAAETEMLLTQQLRLAQTLIEANRKLLLSGDAQISEYAMAIGNLITINKAISENNTNKLQAINELNYLSNK